MLSVVCNHLFITNYSAAPIISRITFSSKPYTAIVHPHSCSPLLWMIRAGSGSVKTVCDWHLSPHLTSSLRCILWSPTFTGNTLVIAPFSGRNIRFYESPCFKMCEVWMWQSLGNTFEGECICIYSQTRVKICPSIACYLSQRDAAHFCANPDVEYIYCIQYSTPGIPCTVYYIISMWQKRQITVNTLGGSTWL